MAQRWGSGSGPGFGTAAALTLSAGESGVFLEAAALYTLALADVHGVHISDLERRRSLFLAIMLGESGNQAISSVAERTGKHWARQLVQRIPTSQIKAINKVLGHNFVTKYGTKQGLVVLGRIVPFGIGAVIGGSANAAMAQAVIRSARRAFGAPTTWRDQVERHRSARGNRCCRVSRRCRTIPDRVADGASTHVKDRLQPPAACDRGSTHVPDQVR